VNASATAVPWGPPRTSMRSASARIRMSPRPCSLDSGGIAGSAGASAPAWLRSATTTVAVVEVTRNAVRMVPAASDPWLRAFANASSAETRTRKASSSFHPHLRSAGYVCQIRNLFSVTRKRRRVCRTDVQILFDRILLRKGGNAKDEKKNWKLKSFHKKSTSAF